MYVYIKCSHNVHYPNILSASMYVSRARQFYQYLRVMTVFKKDIQKKKSKKGVFQVQNMNPVNLLTLNCSIFFTKWQHFVSRCSSRFCKQSCFILDNEIKGNEGNVKRKWIVI